MPDTAYRSTSPQARPDLCHALAEALRRAGHDAGIRAMYTMADTGLAHHHVWLEREQIDWVARLPKQSQMRLDPESNLDYQAACFRRASQGGHAPALHGILPPDPALPRGALLVSTIRGRPARLPDDLAGIAEALASFHVLNVPNVEARPPLLSPADPWTAMLEEVRDQARFLDRAGLEADARALIEAELAALPERLPPGPGTEPRLISFDAHPGNFLITESGRAVLVDLEKCRYGLVGFDLAHASLYTSTTWDLQSHAELRPAEVAAFYRHWITATGFDGDTATLLASRRAMWLWSLTWCAKWRARNLRTRDVHARGEDWSAELSDNALIAHVRGRVDHYLSVAVIEHVRHENRVLAGLLEPQVQG
ncbi:aminoglycoside phosphotransferase family protein [Halomonas sp. ATCH28]|uniref:Aminoglycoside phosphotransferase family protein n=1 Tax=Halomonas gemina TaxID=2945105 RepID=A0ABT0T045_9GAMM|nr:aminoglycoside phosphotransferase family protein [Halomonas gemina]MCL7940242.1 aminoglycoside phosphotransferase family protein [Halomonas gemina]